MLASFFFARFYCAAARCPRAVLLFVAVVLGIPLLFYGIPTETHDAHIHLRWQAQFEADLREGNWYPRWLSSANSGLGSPTFFFYPPLGYWLVTLVRYVTPSEISVERVFGYVCFLALYASGVSCYSWLASVMKRGPSIVGAAWFMMAPYHYGVDLLSRGAYAEFLSFVWLPTVIHGIQRVILTSASRGIVSLALGFAALTLTHLPTALLTGFCGSVVAMGCLMTGRRRRAAMLIFVGLAWGITIVAFYFVPMVLLQPIVSIDSMRSGYLHYSNYFFTAHMINDHFNFTPIVFIACLGTLLPCLLLVVLACRVSVRGDQPYLLILLISGLVVAMMFPISRPIWRAFSVLQAVQFPWRFCSILVPLSALCVAHLADASCYKSLVLAFICSLTFTGWAIKPHMAEVNASSGYDTEPEVPEYSPKWFCGDVSGTARLFGERQKNVLAGRIVEGRAIINSEQAEAPSERKMRVTTDEGCVVDLRLLYMPFWRVNCCGTNHTAIIPARETGLCRLQIPTGMHDITIIRDVTGAEKCGAIMSLAGVVLFGVFCARGRLRTREGQS